MKKFGLLGLVMIMLMAMVGCSQESAKPQTQEAAVKPKETTTTDAVAKPEGVKKPRVAFVYIGVAGDGGWTYEHDRGRKYLEEQLGIKADYVENVPESADSERVISELAQNHDIIFTTSFGYMDYTLDVAKKFPNVIFMHNAGYKTAPNMGTYFGRNYQGSYLAGIAAAKMTKKNLIGYIGAFPIPEVIYNINAFTLGAQSVNKDVKVSVVWSNTWFDPTVERQAAESLLDKGADILMAYQDSPATIQAAAEKGDLAGGNDSDMSRFAPKNYLTNPTWNWGPYYVKVVKSVMDGTWKNDQYWGGMKDGITDIAPLGQSVPDDVKKLVEDTKQKIIAGKLNVFTGPIYDASGQLKVEEGKTLSDKGILSDDWFVKGVDGTIPK